MKKLMMIIAAVAVAFGAIAAQCTAKTQDGARCKREAVEGTKYCWQHSGTNVVRCAATTSDGTQCKRKAEPGRKYCWQHSKSAKKATGTDAKKATPKKATGTDAKKSPKAVAKPAKKKAVAKPAAK